MPHLTVILGASYGAGTYAMSVRAYDNKFTFLWPTAKIAGMGPQQIAGVMSIVRRARAARLGEKFDEKEDAKMVAESYYQVYYLCRWFGYVLKPRNH